MDRIMIVLVVLHLLTSLVYAWDWYQDYDRWQESLIRLVISLFLPLVGVLLCTFFITSANSATFVLGMMSSEGDLNPSNSRKFIWGVLQAALALVLMLCTTNGLNMLQTISIVAAFPFAFILLFAIVAVMKGLKTDPAVKK